MGGGTWVRTGPQGGAEGKGSFWRKEGAGPAEKGGRYHTLTALRPQPCPSPSGPEVRVLLFNSTGDRDPVALLKLLQVRGQLEGGWEADQPRFRRV